MRQKLLALFVILVTPLSFAACEPEPKATPAHRFGKAIAQSQAPAPDSDPGRSEARPSGPIGPEGYVPPPMNTGKMYGLDGEEVEARPYMMAISPTTTCPGYEAASSSSPNADRLEAVTLISQIRQDVNHRSSTWGTGCIEEKAGVSTAAWNHANYLWNASPGCSPADHHAEISGCPNFTGVHGGVRINAATGTTWGSNPGWNETLCIGCGSITDTIKIFMNTPFHVTPFLDYRSEKIGVGKVGSVVVVDFADDSTNPSHLGTWAIWPPAGSWGTPTRFNGYEEPAPPAPSSHPWTWQSVLLGSDSGPVISMSDSLLNVTFAGVQKHGSATWLDVEWFGSPVGGLAPGQWRMYPDWPLLPNTMYRATFAGTRNGSPWTGSWDFVTTSDPNAQF